MCQNACFAFFQNKPAGAHRVGGFNGPPGLGSFDFGLGHDLETVIKAENTISHFELVVCRNYLVTKTNR